MEKGVTKDERRVHLMMNKKGQFQLSFGMIFSIIIIIATVAIAFYVINYFLNLSKCTDAGVFYKTLEDDINKAWSEVITQKPWGSSTKVPSGVKEVCFGNLTQTPLSADKDVYDSLKLNSRRNNNVFLYPSAGCGAEFASKQLEHFRTDNFFCVPVKSGKISIRLTKDSSDALVKVSKP